MNLVGQTVILRGYLGRDAEVPTREVSAGSCVVLALLIESATLDKPTGLRITRTMQIPVVCPGPDYCGVNSDMKEGDSLEIEGELRLCEDDGPVVWSREPRVMRIAGPKIRATRVRRTNTRAMA